MRSHPGTIESVIGSIRVRFLEDDFVASIYIDIGGECKAIHVDTSSGQILESTVSKLTAERWPIVWEPK